MPSDPRRDRVLVIANRTCPCHELHELLDARTTEDARVVIVAPALNGRLAHALSDTDGATSAARERLTAAVDHLEELGMRAEGIVGDSDPLVAIHDTLASFPAEEIVISSWPAGRSNWLEKNLVERARTSTGLPVHHLVSAYGLDAPAEDAA